MTVGLLSITETAVHTVKMNGAQISHLLSMDPFTARYFKGFGMSDTDELPLVDETPALYFLNTDTEDGAGEHWCAGYFEKKIGEFFDPFGMHPSVYGLDDLMYTRKEIVKIKYNKAHLQSVGSSVCGHHCLFYAFFRCRNVPLQSILKMYEGNDTVANDRLVLEFVVQFGNSYYP